MPVSRTNEDEARTVDFYLQSLKYPDIELTSWESDFILSLEIQWRNRFVISDKQFKILQRIYHDKSNSG